MLSTKPKQRINHSKIGGGLKRSIWKISDECHIGFVFTILSLRKIRHRPSFINADGETMRTEQRSNRGTKLKQNSRPL